MPFDELGPRLNHRQHGDPRKRLSSKVGILMTSTTAFFLGAGCSKSFGDLLTKELLPKALKRLKAGSLFEGIPRKTQERADQKFLLQQLESLLPGLRPKNNNGTKSIPFDITEALSLIDHGLENGHHFLLNESLEDLRRLRKLLERAVFEVLWGKGDYSNQGWKALLKFAAWLKAFQNPDQSQAVGIITTNYDFAVESGLFEDYLDAMDDADEEQVAEAFDFGINWRSPFDESQIHLRPSRPRWALYKLHGSVNWLRCPLCEHIYLNVTGHIAFQAFRRTIDDNNTCTCGHAPLEAHIVAPSLVRDIRDSNLLDLWKNAQELLRRASTWYIIGYSFPSEDLAIRSMFLRAYHAREKKPNVIVIQHGEDALPRYKLFFPDCVYHTGGLMKYLDKRKTNRVL